MSDLGSEKFPEIVCDRDLYVGGKLWATQGEVLTPAQVAFAYSREGRRVLGVELPNPVPLEPPLGTIEHVPLHEQIRAMVIQQMSRQAEEQGDETFEDADDFEVGDDYDPTSPFEEVFEPTLPWAKWAESLLPGNKELVDKGGGVQGGEAPPAESPSPTPPEAASRKASSSKKPDRDTSVDP